LLTNPPFPAETFGNLLLLYLKHGCYDLAADVMAENTHLTFRLPQELYDFLDASIMTATSPEEAYRKYDILTARYIDTLRKHTKAVQDARLARDNEGTKLGLKLYDETLQRYIPVLMGMARIYWDRDNYTQVEKIFRQAAEFASENDTWKLNVAHVFMQQGKYAEAIRLYEPIVKKSWEKLTDVTAIVLANLCVAYIMTGQNNMAEITMKKIEEEETEQARVQAEKLGLKVGPGGVIVGAPGSSGSGLSGAGSGNGSSSGSSSSSSSSSAASTSTSASSLAIHNSNILKPAFHLCIVNLVIGTLYCTEGNYDFGVSRVIESLVPYDKKVGVDTWYYAKRCFVAFAEGIAKGMITAQDETFTKVLAFLDAAEKLGAKINTTVGVTTTTTTTTSASGGASAFNNTRGAGGKDPDVLDSGSHTVRYEARMLKRMFLKLRDC
jgi:tetratricopeptide (TPR) repeat protein